MPKNHLVDYRVNFLANGNITGIEVTCCGQHIGEMRFKDGEVIQCSSCGISHSLRLEHNHYHIRQSGGAEPPK